MGSIKPRPRHLDVKEAGQAAAPCILCLNVTGEPVTGVRDGDGSRIDRAS